MSSHLHNQGGIIAGVVLAIVLAMAVLASFAVYIRNSLRRGSRRRVLGRRGRKRASLKIGPPMDFVHLTGTPDAESDLGTSSEMQMPEMARLSKVSQVEVCEIERLH
jgi:hypothetical protein